MLRQAGWQAGLQRKLGYWDPAHWQDSAQPGVCSVHVWRALENNSGSAGRPRLAAGTQSELGHQKPICGQSATRPGMLCIHVRRAM